MEGSREGPLPLYLFNISRALLRKRRMIIVKCCKRLTGCWLARASGRMMFIFDISLYFMVFVFLIVPRIFFSWHKAFGSYYLVLILMNARMLNANIIIL